MSEDPKNRPLSDMEMITLAAVGMTQVYSMMAENQYRASNGAAPTYDHFNVDAINRLETELRRRGLIA